MKDFFVSYTHTDRAWAEWIAWQLEAAGLSTVIQAWDFRPGSHFVREMDRAVQEARRVLAVLSPAYLSSAFAAPEWSFYLAQDPGGAQRLLLPIRVLDCEVKGLLGPVVSIDLVGLEAEEAREVLLAGIREGRAKPASPPGFPGVLPHPSRPEEPGFPGALPLPAPLEPSAAAALKEAYRRKEELTIADGDTRTVEREILDLRRELREGGRLQAGDFLADGRFRLVEPLGQGGFATVWKAYDRRDQGLVAVKVLHGQHGADRTRLERFFRGARKMAELHYPGIVRVLERRLDDGGYHFFAMEYVPGGDLRQAVLEKRLAPERVLPLLAEVAAALDFAHQRGVVHRDVKPANILLDAEGRPKLTDFDLVRAFDSTGGTTLGGGMGTFLYTAPEVMQNPQEAGVAADVYSLAMTAAFCLAGKDLPVDVLRDAGKFLHRLPCPPGVRSVLEKAAAWEPERRFGSVAELARALEGGQTSAREVVPVAQQERPQWPTVREAETLRLLKLQLQGLSENWEERRNIYGRVPEVVSEPAWALRLLDELRQLTRNGNDLFFIDQAVQEVGRRWPEQAREAAELREYLYDHIPVPLEELFRWIETPKDGRVELWRKIPAGWFWMGSPKEEGAEYEHPRHEVTIAGAFRCAAVPVTQTQYAAFADKRPPQESPYHPVVGVTWYEAVSFCRWLSTLFPWTRGARLPVEGEWEYACRAGTESRYWSGNKAKDLSRVGWYDANSNGHTHRVGEKAANRWGLYDVHGNVWEWTLSPWTVSYAGREGGVTHDPAAVEVDPTAAEAPGGGRRVIRGGGCGDDAGDARAAYRVGWSPGVGDGGQGFRVALPAGPELLESRS